MRITRLGIMLVTLLVTLLTVAGFAAFAPDATDPTEPVSSPPSTEVGRQAGEIAALTFTAITRVPSAASQLTEPVDYELRLEEQLSDPSSSEPARLNAPLRLGSYLTELEIRSLVSRHFHPEDINQAIRVIWCESSFDPNRVDPNSGAAGLFQHLPQFWEDRSEQAGFGGFDILSPEANVGVAAWLVYKGRGWEHWSCRA